MARISSARASARARARARARASASARDRASTSARHRALPYHCISQSFDLSPATTSVSHLTCPLPPHHQSELALALALGIELALALDRALLYHHISQSFDLPSATTSVSHLTCPLPPHWSVSTRDRASASARHRALPYHHISHSFDLPPATTSVNHLTCPLPPHQSVI